MFLDLDEKRFSTLCCVEPVTTVTTMEKMKVLVKKRKREKKRTPESLTQTNLSKE
jgi:hypothetical protein